MPKNRIKSLLVETSLRLAALNIRLSGEFNKEFYLQSNKDVASSGQSPIRHYIVHGSFEGRPTNPTAGSDSEHKLRIYKKLHDLLFVKIYYYLLRKTNPHLEDEHWKHIRIIKTSGLFDTRYYLENNKDVLDSNVDPLMHYVAFGYKEGRNPCPSFDSIGYAVQHGISSYSNINPFIHYLSNLDIAGDGLDSGVSSDKTDHSIPFDAKFYLKKYPDLQNADIDAFEHFLSHGLYEGRDSDPSKGGYAEWRSTFVQSGHMPPGQLQPAITSQKVTVCLCCDGNNDEDIQRTFDSLIKQGTTIEVALLGKRENTQPVMDAVKTNPVFTKSNIPVFSTITDVFNCPGDAKDFFAFLTIGDQLLPGALQQVRKAIRNHPAALLHYTDEEIVDKENIVIKPMFKSGFDPDLQLATNYMGNFLVVSAGIRVSHKNEPFETWSVNRALFLAEIMDQLDDVSVNHIPQILYRRNTAEHWSGDQAKEISEKIKNVENQRSTTFESCTVDNNGALRLKYAVPAANNHVSIIIPTRNGMEVLEPCIDGILNKTDYPSYELIIIDNGSDEIEAIDYLASLDGDHSNITVINHNQPFNYSELNNIGVKAASGDFLVFLNNDIEVIDGDWLNELISQAARPDIGVVGALLLFPDDTIQHAGVAVGVGGVAAHSFSGWDPDSNEFAEYNHSRRVSAVTGACMAMRREVFTSVGGFDEENLPVDFNDIDLCLRVCEQGLHVLFTPHAKLYHHESKTRVSHRDNSAEAERFTLEVQWMQARWFAVLTNDPYYSPNFSLGLPGYALAWPPRLNMSALRRPEVPNLNLYVTHSNPERAESIVRTMGKTPHTLDTLACDIASRKRGLSVIILNLDKPEFIVPLIESMRNAESYFNERGIDFEILIGDTGSTDPDVLQMYESAPSFVKVLHDLKYQFSRCNNQVFARLSTCDTVLFLNNDIAFSGSAEGNLFEMFEFLQNNPKAGTVGAQLLFPDKSIQHAGIGVFESGELRGFVYHPDAKQEAYPDEVFPREMWAVTGACLMMRSSDFVAVNGFDEAYRTECQDAALCMEIHRRGLRSFVLAPDEIIHFENGTREKGSEDWPDRQRFMRHWGGWIDMELKERSL